MSAEGGNSPFDEMYPWLEDETLTDYYHRFMNSKSNILILIGVPGTGKTTAIALKTIGEAMSNPNTPIRIVDHHDSSFSNKHLCNLIQEIITSLNLKNLHVNQTKLVVYFHWEMK